jgi:succinoglycan biosynthesis protein ExoA
VTEPLVSVLVPARNEAASIAQCIASVLVQSERKLEVLVVDGGSNDTTRQIVEDMMSRDSRIRLLDNPPGGISRALNVGLSEARGEWLIRVDAHSTIPPHYVALAVKHLQTGRWGGVGGRKDAVATSATGRAIAAALGSRLGVGGSTYHHGRQSREVDHVPFGAYPTALIRRLGGWDEGIAANEDFELDHRIGMSGRPLLFDPTLCIYWRCRETVPALFAQYRRYGAGKAAVACKHPRSIKPRHLVPPALVGYLLGIITLTLGRPRAALGLIPYAAVLIGGSAVVGRDLPDVTARSALPAAFAAMHLGWGIGLWEGLAEQFALEARRKAPRRHITRGGPGRTTR